MSELDLSSGVQSWPPLDKHLESELDLSSGVQSCPLLDKRPESELDLSFYINPTEGMRPGCTVPKCVFFLFAVGLARGWPEQVRNPARHI